ncbi:vanillyl alcohol oxidase [Hypoxylon fragiforme]|uniref:vanillyl alcohol oxidase n=1 Tax=Hypoxylon fragiforme TaxID=63214 RepID=UPI0020C66B36|nr:vanillyl alcohol oxidase [Hypoxylon fragiforme]KAI2604813.1 vanillyl alcohol oxidase [Hypoxylon fragiforme]
MTTQAASVIVPTLQERHSGTPARLGEIAAAAKSRVLENRTLPTAQPRKRSVRLPPGVSLEKFEEAVKELKGALGAENVEVNDQPLVDGWYMEHPNTHDAFHITDQEELVSSATIYPGSTEEVQSTVRWANKFGIPVYPISIGRNLGYGGAAPRVPGAAVIDLGRRMHEIVNIDAENASCVVEPGVTYYKLYEEIQNRKLPLWVDTPDLGGGSVLGNAIDRGVGYTPYGDHFANHCGMEVVLPNGEVLRTGMGAMPGPNGADNPTWQSFQHAFGPSIDGIFSQSNFGIVTKMGFQLMPATEHQSYCFTFPKDEDFEQIVDLIRPLAQSRVLGNVPQLRQVIQELGVAGHRRADLHDGPGPLTQEEISAAASKLPLGDCTWIFYGCQYGPPESIKAQLDVIKAAFFQIPGAKFFLPSDLPPDHYLSDRALVCSGVPVLRDLDWLNWEPNGAHLFFSPIAPTRGKDARKVHEIVAAAHKRYGFNLFPTLCVAGREIHYITNIIYDRADPEAKVRAIKLMREMITECAALGFGEYRTHLLFADQVASTYNWNNSALMTFNETLKDALDPNGILAPGRNGIWPKQFRGKGWELGADAIDLTSIGPRK